MITNANPFICNYLVTDSDFPQDVDPICGHWHSAATPCHCSSLIQASLVLVPSSLSRRTVTARGHHHLSRLGSREPARLNSDSVRSISARIKTLDEIRAGFLSAITGAPSYPGFQYRHYVTVSAPERSSTGPLQIAAPRRPGRMTHFTWPAFLRTRSKRAFNPRLAFPSDDD